MVTDTTDYNKVKELIYIAKKKGFDPVSSLNSAVGPMVKFVGSVNPSSLYTVIFNHEFMQALFPDPQDYNKGRFVHNSLLVGAVPYWESILSRSVLSESPVDYIYEEYNRLQIRIQNAKK